MTNDIEEFKKLISEKKIKTVEEMQKESEKFARSIPNLKEKYENGAKIRGDIIETSIILETAFNELLLKTGGENIVIDEKEKTLKVITGIKNEKELGNLSSFSKKTMLVKRIMKNHFEKPKEIPETTNWFGPEESEEILESSKENDSKKSEEILEVDELNDFERIAAIRDIFAHVPINWLSPELEFSDSVLYKHFFDLDPNWKKVIVAANEFKNIYVWILELIPIYVRSVLLGEQIMQSILFGITLKDPSKEDKKENIP